MLPFVKRRRQSRWRYRPEFSPLRWRQRRFTPLPKSVDDPVLCFAHVTNQMGRIEGDFEKGAADGAKESLRVISLAASRWRAEKDRP